MIIADFIEQPNVQNCQVVLLSIRKLAQRKQKEKGEEKRNDGEVSNFGKFSLNIESCGNNVKNMNQHG